MVQFSANDDSLRAPDGRGTESDARQRIAKASPPFTRVSAGMMLPLVEQITRDLVAVSAELRAQGAQMIGIEKLPKPSGMTAFNEELQSVKEAFQGDRDRLQACQNELAALGVQIESIDEGIVDFPAEINQRPVMLCWKLGEPSVDHWHLAGESFANRRPISDQPFDEPMGAP